MEESLETGIRRALNEIDVSTSGLDAAARLEADAKKTYLRAMLIEEQQNRKLDEPKVFVSFTGSTGETIRDEVIKKINKTRVPDLRVNFHAEHGFRMSTGRAQDRGGPEGDSLVRTHILNAMRPCCIFVGILTKEYQLSEKGFFAPGSWSLIEAGMAIGLGLPVVFFFENGIHEEFWKKYLGDVRHVAFNIETYKLQELNYLPGRIQEAFREIRSESPRRW